MNKSDKDKKIEDLLFSKDILGNLIKLSNEELFEIFKELKNLDFLPNQYSVQTLHKFSVLEHSKRCLLTLDLAMKYYNNELDIEKDFLNKPSYQKSFFVRLVGLLKELDITEDSEDFRVLTIALLFHDIGKGFYDRTEEELMEEAKQSSDKKVTVDSLRLTYKNKNHEERGAQLIYSILEETNCVPKTLAMRVRNIVSFHNSFSMLQNVYSSSKKVHNQTLDFFKFIREIVNFTSDYNFPLTQNYDIENLLIKELNINYLLQLIDMYCVDGVGLVLSDFSQMWENIYQKAKWVLGKKNQDLIDIIRYAFLETKIINDSIFQDISIIMKKAFFKSLRSFSGNIQYINDELTVICDRKIKNEIVNLVDIYYKHTEKMSSDYLNLTSPKEKLHHLNLIINSKDDFNYDFEIIQNRIKITIYKKQAPAGTLRNIIKSIIVSGIEANRTKIKVTDLLAFSGSDGRLLDIITLTDIEGKIIDESIREIYSKNFKILTQKEFTEKELGIERTKKQFEEIISTFEFYKNDIIKDDKKFTELKVYNSFQLNLILYSILCALYTINIEDAKIFKEEEKFVYRFYLDSNQARKLNVSDFKEELISNLNKHINIIAQ